MSLIIHTDGGARGNPGPAAIGVVINEDSKQLVGLGKTIGEATNNVAEYTAVIEALGWITHNVHRQKLEIHFFLDSSLVVNQINGTFKIRDANLRLLLAKVHELEGELSATITYTYVPREQNASADSLVNKALDEALF